MLGGVLALRPTRLVELCEKLSKAPKKNGKVAQYLRSLKISETKFSVVRHGIYDGTYQIMLWKLLEERMSDEDISWGIVAYLTILRFRTFRSLTYDAFPRLVKLILLDLSDKTKNTLGKLSEWFKPILSSYYKRFFSTHDSAAATQAHIVNDIRSTFSSRKRKSSEDHQSREITWRPNSPPCLSPEIPSTDPESHESLGSSSNASSIESSTPSDYRQHLLPEEQDAAKRLSQFLNSENISTNTREPSRSQNASRLDSARYLGPLSNDPLRIIRYSTLVPTAL